MDYEKIFTASYDRALATNKDGKSFLEEFYNRFTSASEEVTKKFDGVDMEKQRQAVNDSLYHMVNCYRERRINDEIIHIAVRHNRLNLDIRPELYDLWLECLIDTARKFDDEFDKFVELSWRIVMSMGITYLKFRYNNLLHKFC